MKTSKNTPRNYIGFNYTKKDSRVEDLNNNNETETEDRKTIGISPAHSDLLETISNLAGLITANDFSTKFNENQRTAFTKQLISSIALETELRMKTEMLFLAE